MPAPPLPNRNVEPALSMDPPPVANPGSHPQKSAPTAPNDGTNAVFVEALDLQKRIHGDGQKLDKQVKQILGQLAEQKLQSSNQLDLVQQKMFLIQSTLKQLQEASLRQDKALEAAIQVSEQRLGSIQKQTDEKLQGLETLLQQVASKLNA